MTTRKIISTFTGQLSMSSITNVVGQLPTVSGLGQSQSVSAKFCLTAEPGGDGTYTTWDVKISELSALLLPIMNMGNLIDTITATSAVISGTQGTGTYYEDNGQMTFSASFNLTDAQQHVNDMGVTIDFLTTGALSAAAVGANTEGSAVDQSANVTFVAGPVVVPLLEATLSVGSSAVGIQLVGSFTPGFPVPSSSPPADYPTVPNIVGMTVAQATATVTSHNLELSTSRLGIGDQAEWGLVVSQNPVPGTRLPPTTLIGAGVGAPLVHTPGAKPGA